MIDSVVNDLPASIARAGDAAASAAAGDTLGRQDFLLLLTTQLQNQNPLDPVQNEAFVAQLAQFSTLEATVSMSESLNKLVESMNVDRLLAGASLVGQRVAAPGGQATLLEGQALEGTVSLPSGADNLQIDVYTPAGELVRTMTLGPQLAGAAGFSWNGMNQAGAVMAAGPYRVEATAFSGGQSAKVAVTTSARVKAVSVDAGTQSLMLELDGGKKVGMADVSRIGG
jgi:flagellar basal-body rod modification protein FlgD